MAYSELIKSFGSIREYMRQFYVYGFRSREEFDQKSARSYDNERRRVESWLGEYMRFRRDAGGKSVFLSVDSRRIPANPLYKAFKAKSFTDRDITLHFCLLDALAEGEALTTRELTEAITEVVVDESTVRKKLREYQGLGLVAAQKRGRELVYRRADSDVDLAPWVQALQFYSEADPLGVVGSYLLDRLESTPGVFRFKHHYILRALESEVLYQLICAIDARRSVELQILSAKNAELQKYHVIPLRIRVSTQEGRYYLLAWHAEQSRPALFRLDRIESIRALGEAEDFDEYLRQAKHFCEQLWGASAGAKGRLDHIEMTLRVEENEGFILQRLQREKRCGRVEVQDAHTLRFVADVYDAGEMLPWLRSFIGRIEKLECSNPQVMERFCGDFAETCRMYGGETDAVQ